MTHHAEAETAQLTTINSCLGDSLRRLKNNVRHVRDSRERDQGQFEAWLRQWSRRSDQIAKRLEMIDSQLDRILDVTPTAPHFRIIEADDR